MTNFEKYKDELVKIKGCFAFNKNTREILKCDSVMNCEDCLFNEGDCFESDKIKWLCEEYKEPILSDNELELINILSKVYGKEFKYIRRTSHHVFIFSDKPPVDKYGVILDEGTERLELFPNIKFEDGLYDIKNKCFIKE